VKREEWEGRRGMSFEERREERGMRREEKRGRNEEKGTRRN
jgi:hypothetical protein